MLKSSNALNWTFIKIMNIIKIASEVILSKILVLLSGNLNIWDILRVLLLFIT